MHNVVYFSLLQLPRKKMINSSLKLIRTTTHLKSLQQWVCLLLISFSFTTIFYSTVSHYDIFSPWSTWLWPWPYPTTFILSLSLRLSWGSSGGDVNSSVRYWRVAFVSLHKYNVSLLQTFFSNSLSYIDNDSELLQKKLKMRVSVQTNSCRVG